MLVLAHPIGESPIESYQFEGVWPAVTVQFDESGQLNVAMFADHCRWLVGSGATGVVVNGSLGEYEALTESERRNILETAVQAVGQNRVVPGVSDKSGDMAVMWAEHGKALGVPALMALPPTSHAPTEDEVVAHFAKISEVGIPIIAYNNPFSTRVDLVPALLGRLVRETLVFAVKDFSQDVRRVLHTLEEAPGIQVIAGCDDVLIESVVTGARGWIAGFVNAFPEQSVFLYDMALAGNLDTALPLYREMLPILRWDADPRFVQAIKLGQEEAGRYGGPVRLPRLPLSPEVAERVRADARRAIEAGAV